MPISFDNKSENAGAGVFGGVTSSNAPNGATARRDDDRGSMSDWRDYMMSAVYHTFTVVVGLALTQIMLRFAEDPPKNMWYRIFGSIGLVCGLLAMFFFINMFTPDVYKSFVGGLSFGIGSMVLLTIQTHVKHHMRVKSE